MNAGKASRNERRKAMAATLNAVGVAAVVGGVLRALLGETITWETALLAFAIFAATQGALHALLKNIED